MTPLGIQDIIDLNHPEAVSAPDGWDECWYWCRRHEQAARADRKCSTADDFGSIEYAQNLCIRVGPFMTEHEAQRLNGHALYRNIGGYMPLGMEVEP